MDPVRSGGLRTGGDATASHSYPNGKSPSSLAIEVLAVDFTVLEPATDGHENVLVMTDVFTKF